MCGSAAILRDEQSVEPAVRAALKLLESRGPDGSGVIISGSGALGHCRLSLRDFAGGAQPLRLADGRTLAFVGEIYNDEKLRQLLQLNGWTPANHSDTEILAEAVTRYDNAAWERLDGMFAVMLLSADGRALEIIRDRFGIKPAYFSVSGTSVAAASEPAAVIELTGRQSAARAVVLHFLQTSQVASNGSTVWQNIQLAPPGSTTTLTTNSIRQDTWAPRMLTDHESGDDSANPAKLLYLLGEAVYRQARADFPIGVFLSGGLDSSLLAALYARQNAAPIHTFAVALAGDTDDLQHAQRVAEQIGSTHRAAIVSIDDFFTGMRDLTVQRGLPVSLPNEVLIYSLAQVASREVKAVLSGEGADELFSGYQRLLARLRQSAHPQADMPSAFRAATTWFSADDLRNSLRSVDDLESLQYTDHAALGAQLEGVPLEQAPRALLLADHFPHLLMRLDGASMAGSIEGRVPFTDPDVVQFALSLRAHDLRPQFGLEKPILRKAGVGLLSESCLRRPKRAFHASLPLLFSSSVGQSVLKRALQQPLIAQLFDQESLERLLNEDFRNQVFHRTWLICSLGMWCELCRVNEIN